MRTLKAFDLVPEIRPNKTVGLATFEREVWIFWKTRHLDVVCYLASIDVSQIQLQIKTKTM
jgi:hypothetical protein